MSQITSIKIDYSQDPQVSSGHSSLDRTQKGHEPGNGEAFRHSVSTAFGSRFGTDGDYGSFVIPKDAEKAELGEDELTRTFDAIIEAHPEILESNKPTSGLLQLREVQELAWNDQLRFRGYVIGRRCLRMKEKGKE